MSGLFDPYDPFGFRENDRRRDRWQTEAKQTFVNGIDPADLKPGMIVTVSPNLRMSDRSYTTDLLEVVAVNAGHCQVRPCGSDREPAILLLHEHHFYSAETFERPEREQK